MADKTEKQRLPRLGDKVHSNPQAKIKRVGFIVRLDLAGGVATVDWEIKSYAEASNVLGDCVPIENLVEAPASMDCDWYVDAQATK